MRGSISRTLWTMGRKRNGVDLLAAAQGMRAPKMLGILGIGDQFAIDDQSARVEALRAALPEALKSTVQPRIQADSQRRAVVLALIAEGASIAEAARSVGLTPAQVHHIRRTEPKFAEAVALAIQCAQDPVIARLQSVALHGRSDSISTIRAAEQYLRATGHPSFQPPIPRVTMSKTLPDGSVAALTVSAGGIPD